MEYFKENWFWLTAVVFFGILWAITQNTWSRLERGNPGPPAASPLLYSRADLSLTPEEETFADEILAGIRRVTETVPGCTDLDPGLIKVSGSRETKTGYVFFVRCPTGGKTVYFNQDKILSISNR